MRQWFIPNEVTSQISLVGENISQESAVGTLHNNMKKDYQHLFNKQVKPNQQYQTVNTFKGS